MRTATTRHDALWRALEREAAVSRHTPVFVAAQARRAAIANYATAGAALDASSGRTGASMDEREEIVSALLRETQAAPHPLWGAMLALTFKPMLLRLAVLLEELPGDEREQYATVAFLDAVARCTPGPGAIVRLYWAARRQATRPLTQERLRAESEIDFVEDDFFSTGPSADAPFEVAEIARRIAATEPRKGERPDEYIARVNGERCQEEVRRLHVALLHTRLADLAEVRARCSNAVNQ